MSKERKNPGQSIQNEFKNFLDFPFFLSYFDSTIYISNKRY